MAFLVRKFANTDSVDMREFPVVTTNVAANTIVIWGTGGVNGAPGTAPQRHAVAGIAQTAAIIGANTLVSPLFEGMVLETVYSTGTPAIGDAVEIVDANSVRIKTVAGTVEGSPAIARVVKVLNATGSAIVGEDGSSIAARTVLIQVL